jgi:hypothetical protein
MKARAAVWGLVLAGSVLTLNADTVTVTLNASDLGWYSSAGFHQAGNKNYIAADGYRDYFVFDLSARGGTVISAQLSLYNPCATCPNHDLDGYNSPNPSEIYQVTSVTTDIAKLEAQNTSAESIFDDLGTNTVYGTQTVSAADDGEQVVITLNASAVAALNATTGLIAFGGRLRGPPAATVRQIFSNTNIFTPPFDVTQLILVTVPEPASLLLIGVGMVGLFIGILVLNSLRTGMTLIQRPRARADSPK